MQLALHGVLWRNEGNCVPNQGRDQAILTSKFKNSLSIFIRARKKTNNCIKYKIKRKENIIAHYSNSEK